MIIQALLAALLTAAFPNDTLLGTEHGKARPALPSSWQGVPQDADADGEDAGPTGLELSLKDAISSAFANNLSLRGALLDTEASLQGFNAAWGDFDTTFFTTVTQSSNTSPPTDTNFVGSAAAGGNPKAIDDVFTLSSGFRGKWQTGTTWELNAFAQTRENEQRTKPLSSRSEVNTGNWRFQLTHPLLRDSEDFAMSGVRLAAQDVMIASLDGEITANSTIQTVITNYWNLVFSLQDAGTRDLSVELASDLLSVTRRKYEQGIQNRIDVIEAEAEVARRREEQLTAHNTLEQAMDDLSRLVYAPSALDQWAGRILPVTDYTVLPEDVPTMQTAVAVALEKRPDVIRARLAVERADIEITRAKNGAKNRLDVTGQYGVNAQNDNLSSTIRDYDEVGNDFGSLSLNFEMSLGNRQSGYTVRRRRIERERAAVSKSEIELNAIAEVRQSTRDVSLQTERVVATAETTRLRREVYEGEIRRLENDLSTPFQVRESQRDLLEAIDSELRARLDLAVAHTQLKASQGTLLDLFGYDRYEPELEESPPAWDE